MHWAVVLKETAMALYFFFPFAVPRLESQVEPLGICVLYGCNCFKQLCYEGETEHQEGRACPHRCTAREDALPGVPWDVEACPSRHSTGGC